VNGYVTAERLPGGWNDFECGATMGARPVCRRLRKEDSMSRKDLFYTLGLLVVAALLLANLLRPATLGAYNLPEGSAPVAIAASGDSGVGVSWGTRSTTSPCAREPRWPTGSSTPSTRKS